MNVRQLKAFKTVMDRGSITQAAATFNITQPAMSSMIAALEADVGFALFERSKGRIRPTPEALSLYEEVEKALTGFDKVVRTAYDIRDLRTGQLRIASFPAPSFGFLPRIVAAFHRAYPEVTVSLQTRSSPQVNDWIESQLFDIGLAELPVDRPAIEVEPMAVACVCILPAGDPLRRLDTITPPDLQGRPFISLNPDHVTHRRLKAAFEAAGVPWQPQMECQLFAPACSLAAQGIGVTVVDPFTAEDFADRGIVVRPFEPAILHDMGILYPALRPRSRLAEAFADLLKRELARFVQPESRAAE